MTECHKELQQLMDSTVSVVTNDGRTMFGTLKGLDQKLNLILEECKERVFSKEEGVEEVGVPCALWDEAVPADSARDAGAPLVLRACHARPRGAGPHGVPVIIVPSTCRCCMPAFLWARKRTARAGQHRRVPESVLLCNDALCTPCRCRWDSILFGATTSQ
jgi:small nuclear ribonucleoprotein (snRNP)-like protein